MPNDEFGVYLRTMMPDTGRVLEPTLLVMIWHTEPMYTGDRGPATGVRVTPPPVRAKPCPGPGRPGDGHGRTQAHGHRRSDPRSQRSWPNQCRPEPGPGPAGARSGSNWPDPGRPGPNLGSAPQSSARDDPNPGSAPQSSARNDPVPGLLGRRILHLSTGPHRGAHNSTERCPGRGPADPDRASSNRIGRTVGRAALPGTTPSRASWEAEFYTYPPARIGCT